VQGAHDKAESIKGAMRTRENRDKQGCKALKRKQLGIGWNTVMDQLQTSGELQDKTSFIDSSTGVGLLKGCSPDHLLL
jgi:hypothetical protein